MMLARTIICALTACACVSLSAVGVSWPMDELCRAPRVFSAEAYRTNGVEVAFLEGLPCHGKPTKVFCYYGVPKHRPGEKVPGMVLVHGGGGSAFYRWVRFWNGRGYAAISMDTCGCVSGNTVGSEQRKHFRHPDGGPAGWGGFGQTGAKVEDQWLYHAVADVILSHSFLRSLDGVDPDRIGLTGVSWGAVISSIVSGVDDRFVFAAPVYGCGAFLENSPMWEKDVVRMGPAKTAEWKTLWDPIHYLSRAKMPIHWLAGTNDRAFSLPALMESYAAVPTEKSLAVKVRLPHNHSATSEEALELTTWADSHLCGVPLPQPIRAELSFTKSDAKAWIDRKWETVPAKLEDGKPVADIPVGTTAYYFNTSAENGFLVSMPVQMPVQPSVPDQVRASAFGYDAADATKAVQAAIDSGARTVIVDRQAGDWIVRPLKIVRSDLEFVLEPGVILRAKPGEYHGRNDVLLRISEKSSNVTVRGGAGSRLEMDRESYADPDKYSYSQWRHALYIGDARQVVVRDLTFSRSGGDGVYVSGAADVTLENLTCTDNYRQGMSVISVDGLRVRHCRFVNTAGVAPQCGVDFEPNGEKNKLKDVLFEDCVFEGNAASGLDIHVPHLRAASEPLSLTFRRCVMRGNRECGITTFATKEAGGVRGKVAFEDCQIGGNGRTALLMCNQSAMGIAFSFANCTFDGRGGGETTFRFVNSSLSDDFAGVSFDRCRAMSDEKRFCSYGGLAGTGVTDVRGTVAVTAGMKTTDVDLAALAKQYPPNPELRRFAVARVDYPSLKPASSKLEKPVTTPWLRRGFTFVQRVPGPGDYPVKFRIRPLRKGRSPAITLQLRDQVGTDLGFFKITDKESYEHVIHCLSAKGNVYRLEVQSGLGSAVQVESSVPGGILFDEPINLFGANGAEFFFSVPATADEVMVQVRPDEPASAELRDVSGKTVASLAYGRDGSVLKARRQGKGGEIWSVFFPKMREDCYLRIGAPALPVGVTDRQAVVESRK